MTELLYEDDAVFVVKKPAGVESQRGKSFSMDMESRLKNLLAQRDPKGSHEVYVVHRLDRPVAGVMVYAKTRKAAAALSGQFSGTDLHKIYEAVVTGDPEPEGRLEDFLYHDKKNNLSKIVGEGTAGAKKAVLEYKKIPFSGSEIYKLEKKGEKQYSLQDPSGETAVLTEEEAGRLSLLQIRLQTGRHHQIRVQLAGAGMQILGDSRYDGLILPGQMRGKIALCASTLRFIHPVTKKEMTFFCSSPSQERLP